MNSMDYDAQARIVRVNKLCVLIWNTYSTLQLCVQDQMTQVVHDRPSARNVKPHATLVKLY